MNNQDTQVPKLATLVELCYLEVTYWMITKGNFMDQNFASKNHLVTSTFF